MRSTWRSSSIATSPGAPPDRPVFVLDHNFPEPILLDAVERWVLELELRRLREIDPRLTRGFDDWQVVLALSQLGFDGFVTNDDDMLWVPEVVSVIEQTAMSVVVCEKTGDDAVVASGLLLAHLPRVAKRFQRQKPQIWRLKATEQRPVDFSRHRAEVEERSKRRLADFELSDEQLRTPLL
jgi:hypothetical protein